MRTALRYRLAIRLVLAFSCAGPAACSLVADRVGSDTDGELFATTSLAKSVIYHHRWPGFPCYSVRLPGHDWELLDSTAARARWQNGDHVLSIYFTDNRVARFSHVIAPSETVLRSYLGYELSYVRPSFAFPETDPPRFATDDNGAWMQWGWQGLGGLRIEEREAPADQRHVIANLWVDPWVMSFDWATERIYAISGPTPSMIDVLDSLEFDPTCNR